MQQDLDDEDAGLDPGDRLRAVLDSLRPGAREAATWAVSAHGRSADTISGDLVNWTLSADGSYLSITLGDVMGKGTPAGLLAAHLLGAFDALEREKPAAAVEGAEHAIRKRLERSSAFATLFHGRLRLSDGALEFVDAGHGFAAIGRWDGPAERIVSADLPIGLQPIGVPRLPRRHRVDAGGVLLIASDGILELPGASFDTLTTLATQLTRSDDLDADLLSFLRAAPEVLDDDLTLIAVRRAPHTTSLGPSAPDADESSTDLAAVRPSVFALGDPQ